MAYTWTTGETITAENLNKTGQTLVLDGELVNDGDYGVRLSITASELLQIANSGTIIIISMPTGETYDEHKQLVIVYNVNYYSSDGQKEYSFEILSNNFSNYAFNAYADDEYPFCNWD